MMRMLEADKQSGLKEIGENLNVLCLKGYNSYRTLPQKTRETAVSRLMVRMSAFLRAEGGIFTGNDSLDLDRAGDRKTALFLITGRPEHRKGAFVPLMYSQLFHAMHTYGDAA